MKNQFLVGKKINNIEITDYYSHNGRQFFKCTCFCGRSFDARADGIKASTTKSCGCKTREFMSKNHTLDNDAAVINIVYRNYKYTAGRKKLQFTLTIEEFKKLIFGNCVYCGAIPTLSKFSGASKKNKKDMFLNYNGIDRVNNTIHYTPENCVSCCSICNRAKSDLSIEDFKQWICRLSNFNQIIK